MIRQFRFLLEQNNGVGLCDLGGGTYTGDPAADDGYIKALSMLHVRNLVASRVARDGNQQQTPASVDSLEPGVTKDGGAKHTLGGEK